MTAERVWCAYCLKECAGFTKSAYKGDGLLYPRTHKGPDGKTCEGVYVIAHNEDPREK